MIRICNIICSDAAALDDLKAGFYSQASKILELNIINLHFGHPDKFEHKGLQFDMIVVEDEYPAMIKVLEGVNYINDLQDILICADNASLRRLPDILPACNPKLITLDYKLDVYQTQKPIDEIALENHAILSDHFINTPIMCLSSFADDIAFEEMTTDIRKTKTSVYDKSVLGPALPTIIRDKLAHEALTEQYSGIEKEKDLYAERLAKANLLDNADTAFELIGEGVQMSKLRAKLINYSQYDKVIFLRGERGTGKEVAARCAHRLMGNKGRFFSQNCASLSEELMDMALFGYKGESFTGGSKKDRKGAFEDVGDGTVFLDEIGSLPYNLQPKLLTAIRSREFTPVGGTKNVKFSARIIVATNESDEFLKNNTNFREDLFDRLNEQPIIIPPLRSRKEDIQILSNFFIDKENREQFGGRLKVTLTKSCLLWLKNYDWPGNVRELQDLITATVREAYHLNHQSLELRIDEEMLQLIFNEKSMDISGATTPIVQQTKPQFTEPKTKSSSFFNNKEDKKRAKVRGYMDQWENGIAAVLDEGKDCTEDNVASKIGLSRFTSYQRRNNKTNLELMVEILKVESDKFPNLHGLIMSNETGDSNWFSSVYEKLQ